MHGRSREQQLDRIQADPKLSASPSRSGPVNETNFFEWEAYIKGPDDTPYEGGVFCAKLFFPRDYPLNPPKVRVCEERGKGKATPSSMRAASSVPLR